MQEGEEIKAAATPNLRTREGLLAALKATIAQGAAEQRAQVPWWPAYCARCCRRGYKDLTEPWCESCAESYSPEYGPVFRAWVLRKRRRYLQAAEVPPAFRLCGLDNFETRSKEQERALLAVREWCASDRPGLFLHGAVGTGKTHLAVAALLEKLAAREHCRFVAVRELILECRESFRRDRLLSDIIDGLTEGGPDFLLLDDLGVERPTEFVREALELLIDRIYAERQQRLIISSNADLDGLGRSLGERIADRLRELCVVVRLGGSSHRRRIAARRAGVGEGGSNL